ncbi:MAG TPA: amino acid adenylation domain-containing protein, partial [Vicinamibacterales bacterium]|nr:amino acid adenylation domain-containing protein [Vicinamibacterales bacterium]
MTADSGHVVTTNPSLLHQFFFSQALRTPDALAIDIPQSADGRRRRATYAELAGAARVVAHDLRRHVSGETLVALLFPRTSIEAYASQLGVLAAGAAYVSLDPALPDARLADMVADAEPAAVITDAAGAHRAAALGIDAARVLLAPGAPAAGHGTDAPPPSWLSPQTLAYVIYTSGTTGRPKGVMMAHRAITNLVASDVALFQLGPGDRVAQSSSHGYDSSVEEIWLALATGATLVVPDDQTVRAGPDVLDWLVGERITVWCPSPTLLRATGCRHAHEVPPALRLVYVGGEPMPPDVVAVWAPGRRLVNGYGPTECAVVATRAEMSPSRPVSIGWPIPGNEAWVLNQVGGDLVEAAPGEPGELCLGGVGLARGYWQAPDVTARKFVDHPHFGRLYRTGDLATRTDDGELYCHGRLDAQVKIRGHRVELEDIEAHLCRVPGVRAAACTVHGHSLVALVIPVDRAAPPVARVVIAAAAAELPGHMVPARVVTVTELPMTAGGKLDRPRLPALIQDAVDQSHSMPEAPPSTPLEARIASAVSSVMGGGRPVPVDAHLFEALGADSLAAAEIVTALRMHEETAAVTVRDLYAAPTVRRLSERLAARTAAAGNGGVAGGPRSGAVSSVNPARATVAQAAWLVATLLVGSATSAVVIVIALPWLLQAAGLVPFLLALPLVGAVGYGCYGALSIVTALVTKRLLIGRYTPCREPVWGSFYVRNWIVQRAVGRMPWRLLEGTEFQVMLLRALGARIGRRVHLHRGVDLTTGGWDLLTIGDDVSLNQEAALRLIDVEAGSLVVGPITIENEATIEVRAGLGPRTLVEHGATLTALSSLASGSRIPAGERWTGVPAEPDGHSAARPALTSQARTLSATTHGVLLMGVRLAVTGLAVGPWLGLALATVWMTGADATTVLAWLSAPTWSATSAGALAMLTIVPLPVTLALEAWVIRLLGPVRGGVIDRLTLDYARVWAKTLLVNDAGPWLSGSLAWRSWLRAAGMRLGPDAEVSTI